MHEAYMHLSHHAPVGSETYPGSCAPPPLKHTQTRTKDDDTGRLLALKEALDIVHNAGSHASWEPASKSFEQLKKGLLLFAADALG